MKLNIGKEEIIKVFKLLQVNIFNDYFDNDIVGQDEQTLAYYTNFDEETIIDDFTRSTEFASTKPWILDAPEGTYMITIAIPEGFNLNIAYNNTSNIDETEAFGTKQDITISGKRYKLYSYVTDGGAERRLFEITFGQE